MLQFTDPKKLSKEKDPREDAWISLRKGNKIGMGGDRWRELGGKGCRDGEQMGSSVGQTEKELELVRRGRGDNLCDELET